MFAERNCYPEAVLKNMEKYMRSYSFLFYICQHKQVFNPKRFYCAIGNLQQVETLFSSSIRTPELSKSISAHSAYFLFQLGSTRPPKYVFFIATNARKLILSFYDDAQCKNVNKVLYLSANFKIQFEKLYC